MSVELTVTSVIISTMLSMYSSMQWT